MSDGNVTLTQEEMEEFQAELDAGGGIVRLGPGVPDDVAEVSADPDEVRHLKGKCPACGGSISVGERAFESECGWKAWRSLFTHDISVAEMEEILRDGQSRVITDFESPRTGNEFSARLKLATVDPDGGDGEPPKRALELVFVDRPQEAVGKCPKCKGNVVHRGKHYFCEHNNRKDASGNEVTPKCDFVLWGELSSKKLPESAVAALLEGKTTRVLKGFTSRSSGKDFDAALKLGAQGKVDFVFQEKKAKAPKKSRFDEE